MDDSIKEKVIKIRSVAYPSYTISYCVSLTESIHKFFGNSVFIPIEKISEKLGVSESHLQQQLSSCNQYGLLEVRPKEGYKPTPLFIKIYKPLPTEDVLESKKEAFLNPELYKKVIEQENNKTHTVDSLATLLLRSFKVAEKASEKAATIFIQNANELAFINEDNFFSTEKKVANSNIEDDFEDIENKEKETESNVNGNSIKILPPPNDLRKPKNTLYPPIQVVLDDGSISETYIPNGFNKPDIERIIRVLTAYIA